MAKRIRLVDPNAVDHVAPVASHDMEQVVRHFGLRVVLLHLQIEGGVHVDSHRFDLCVTLAEQLEERTDGITTVALGHPERTRALGIHDDRGVAVVLVQGELIHHQVSHIAWLEDPYAGVQAALVDGLDRMPVQSDASADMADRQHLQQGLDPRPQPLRQP